MVIVFFVVCQAAAEISKRADIYLLDRASARDAPQLAAAGRIAPTAPAGITGRRYLVFRLAIASRSPPSVAVFFVPD